jgi:3-hydroxy-3-methylglutaryl CoA synthase
MTNKGYNDGVKSVISELQESGTLHNSDVDKIVFCKHTECKDEPTCLRYMMAKMREQELDELEEGTGMDREELEGLF